MAEGQLVAEFDALLEHLPTGLIVFTPALEITFVNRAAQRLLEPARARRGDQLPEPWPDFSLRAYAERLLRPGRPDDEQVEVGGHVYRVSGISPHDTRSAAILLDDVTASERRRRAEREFVANAAHELLTPLTGIVAAAHVLEAGAKEVPQDRDQFIGHIARECTRLAHVARALLVLARAQSGEQPPRLDVIPVCEIVQEAVELAGFGAEAVNIDCDEDLTVYADPDLLAQAFTNLLANALRHGAGGKVDVTGQREPVGRVTVFVSNEGASGSGDLDTRRRFQSPQGLDGEGFGLGISIARQSLEVLGGTLTYETDGDTLRARIVLPAGIIDR